MMFTSFSLVPAAVTSMLVSTTSAAAPVLRPPTEIVRSLSFCFFKGITGPAELAGCNRNDKYVLHPLASKSEVLMCGCRALSCLQELCCMQ